MSLINDALKKAERERAAEQSGPVPGLPAGRAARLTKRGAPMKAQSLLLLAAGAIVLVIVSAVLTGIFVAGRPAEKKAAAHPATVAGATALPSVPRPAEAKPAITSVSAAPPAAVSANPAPVLPPKPPAPAEPPPMTAAATASAPAAPANVTLVGPAQTPAKPAVSGSAAAAVAEASPTRGANGSVDSPAPAPTAPSPEPFSPSVHLPAPPPVPDNQVQAFVDALKISGVRFSGSDSKVLINQRVYRIKDLVDRTLNLRLVKVTADTLVFQDGNGAMYTRNL